MNKFYAVQMNVDRFYTEHGDCCAGCDFWAHMNSAVGECRKSAPVHGDQRIDMLGVGQASLHIEAGHVMTPREHLCSEFKDDFNWASLGLFYLRRIGRKEGAT